MKSRYLSKWCRVGWAVVLVTGVASLVFFRGISALFVAEDFEVLLCSSLNLHTFGRVILLSTRFKPFALLVDWLAFRLWGTWPIGYHAISLFAHAVCSIGVLCLGARLSRNPITGIIAGLIFAVYPRHHEAVLWLAASQFVFCTAFLLLALLSFVAYLRSQRLGYYLIAWGCAIGALANHEIGVMVLPLMFLSELVVREETEYTSIRALCRPQVYMKYIPFLLLLILFVYLSFGGQRAFKLQLTERDPRIEHETYHFMGIGLNEIKSLVSYAVYLVLPQIPLRSLDVGVGSVVLSLVVVGSLLSLFVFGGAVERFCLLWMGGALLPFVFFVPFGNADRYFYLSAVGFSLLVGQLSVRLYRRLKKRWMMLGRAVGIFILILYLTSSAALAQVRIDEWRQAGEIAQDIIEQVVKMHPRVPPHSRMFFVGLPGRYGHAYVFLGGGIGGAMRMVYNDLQLKVYRSVDPNLENWLATREEVGVTSGQYVFLYQNGILLDKSACVDDFDQFYESWWWYL